jgi:transposase-like protein
MSEKPITLARLASEFSDDEKARELLERLRWPDGVECPHCEAIGAYKIEAKEGSKSGARKGLWKCVSCRQQFTVTVNTIMEDSKIPLSKWLIAIYLICSSKKGYSSLQLKRDLGLGSYKTAWFMSHRIRYAMSQEPLFSKLRGIVEIDESYVGGKAANMHKSIRAKRETHGGAAGKAPVLTLVQRGGEVRTRHIEQVTAVNLKKAINECIAPTSELMTDELRAYREIRYRFAGHQYVTHSKEEYVRGVCHINTAESVHALLKRGVYGVYHHWSKKHLHRYLSEFDFRWNHRKINDGERMKAAIASVGGKRLMYKDPIGRNKKGG